VFEVNADQILQSEVNEQGLPGSMSYIFNSCAFSRVIHMATILVHCWCDIAKAHRQRIHIETTFTTYSAASLHRIQQQRCLEMRDSELYS